MDSKVEFVINVFILILIRWWWIVKLCKVCFIKTHRKHSACVNQMVMWSFFLPLGWADPPGGGPAGRGRRCPLCWRQHTGRWTQDAGPRACEGAAEAEQTWYPGHLRRGHTPTGWWFGAGLVFAFSAITTEWKPPEFKAEMLELQAVVEAAQPVVVALTADKRGKSVSAAELLASLLCRELM